MSTVSERVQAGIDWLNQKEPGWQARINIAKFNIQSFNNCPLGQVFGGWGLAYDKFPELQGQGNPADYGFDAKQALTLDEVTADFEALQVEWLKRLRRIYHA